MNHTDFIQNDEYNTLIHFCLDIPIAFAIWENQSDTVLISSKMQSIIRADSLLLYSLDFVKSIKSIFGNFLYDAVYKISNNQFSNSKYSTTFKTVYNKIYSLILHYNIKSQIYMFTALDVTHNNNVIDNNTQSNEVKILNEILDKIPLFVWRRSKNAKITYNNKYCTNNLGNKLNDLDILKNNNINTNTKITLNIKGENRDLNINEYFSVYGNNQIIGIANDITNLNNLNNIEQELNEYKTSAETVINNINCGIALFNGNMKLLLINDYAKNLFNLSNINIYSKSYSEIVDYILSNELIISNLSNTIFRNRLLEIVSTVKNAPIEKHISMNSHENINVKIIPNGKNNILFIFSDNSFSVDMARNINSVKQIYNKVINNISDGIIIFGPDNKIKLYNDIVKNIFDIEKENIDNLNIKDFFELLTDLFNNTKYLEQFVNKLFNNATQRTSYSEVMNLLNKKIIDYTYIPIHDGLSLIVLKDISNYKSMEISLKTASDKINHALELKNNLISTISDEYCAPLDTISSFAEILNNKYFGELNDKQQEYCNGIIKTSNHLKDISEMVSYITRIQTEQIKLNLTEVNVSSFIKTNVEQFRNFGKNVKILVTGNNNSLKAYVDKNIVNRIIYYAISQAVCMVEDNGIIQIESSIYESDNKYFVITISDNGYGLSTEDVILYNRYLSSNVNIGEIKTMDLRYAVLHHMAHFHNGRISLESQENNGTRIKIILQINQFNH
ncbi:MAG: HAMP domain-containing histidine kinase [Alphaproteobacteria bacterium]|nr:HAMP domain-containing histidine kinase [Alphaproteobacteria bacterium]